MSPDYLWIMLALVGSLAIARLPVRTRMGFVYLGLAILTFGGVVAGQLDGQSRYLAVAGAGITLGVASVMTTFLTRSNSQRVVADNTHIGTTRPDG